MMGGSRVDTGSLESFFFVIVWSQSSIQGRVEGVAQAVAHEVEPKDCDHDRKAWEEHEVGSGDSVLPNRSVVVWPYTTLSEPEFDFALEMITISASVRQAKTKIGMANRRGWVAYEFEGELFVKWSPIHDDEQTYTDLNASMQCFRNEDFIELESVGPLVDLACGANVRHVEVWALIPLVDVGVSEALASLRADPSALG